MKFNCAYTSGEQNKSWRKPKGGSPGRKKKKKKKLGSSERGWQDFWFENQGKRVTRGVKKDQPLSDSIRGVCEGRWGDGGTFRGWDRHSKKKEKFGREVDGKGG